VKQSSNQAYSKKSNDVQSSSSKDYSLSIEDLENENRCENCPKVFKTDNKPSGEVADWIRQGSSKGYMKEVIESLEMKTIQKCCKSNDNKLRSKSCNEVSKSNNFKPSEELRDWIEQGHSKGYMKHLVEYVKKKVKEKYCTVKSEQSRIQDSDSSPGKERITEQFFRVIHQRTSLGKEEHPQEKFDSKNVFDANDENNDTGRIKANFQFEEVVSGESTKESGNEVSGQDSTGEGDVTTPAGDVDSEGIFTVKNEEPTLDTDKDTKVDAGASPSVNEVSGVGREALKVDNDGQSVGDSRASTLVDEESKEVLKKDNDEDTTEDLVVTPSVDELDEERKEVIKVDNDDGTNSETDVSLSVNDLNSKKKLIKLDKVGEYEDPLGDVEKPPSVDKVDGSDVFKNIKKRPTIDGAKGVTPMDEFWSQVPGNEINPGENQSTSPVKHETVPKNYISPNINLENSGDFRGWHRNQYTSPNSRELPKGAVGGISSKNIYRPSHVFNSESDVIQFRHL